MHRGISKFWKFNLSFIITVVSIRIFELILIPSKLIVPDVFYFLQMGGVLFDLVFAFSYSLLFIGIYTLINRVNNTLAIIILNILNVFSIISLLSLIVFFSERTSPLDEELIVSSVNDTFIIIKSSGIISLRLISVYIMSVVVYFCIYYILSLKLILNSRVNKILLTVSVVLFGINILYTPSFEGNEFAVNKLNFITKKIVAYWVKTDDEETVYSYGEIVLTPAFIKEVEFYQKEQGFDFVSKKYPLLHKKDSSSVLEPFFNLKDTKPNIVVLIVESLSRDFCGDGASLGNFATPFIDSLSHKSLYWSNCLSSSPISFEVLPTILASLPYGKKGFSLLPNYPNHLSLIQVLNASGYSTNYITGAPLTIANQGVFIRNQEPNYISYNFSDKYNDDNVGWWGYPDKALFSYGMDILDSKIISPYLNIFVTMTTHPPYLYNEKDKYGERFDREVLGLALSKYKLNNVVKNREALSSFMYLDDCLRDFFTDYKKRSDYNNTIFIITGDHQAYMSTKNELTRFHVPLLIFSPLLAQARAFSSLNMHQSITPSILSLLSTKYPIEEQELAHWVGGQLDTCKLFRNVNSFPLIDSSKDINFYIYGNYFIKDDNLYQILNDRLDVKRLDNDELLDSLKRKLDNYKVINNYCCYGNNIMPIAEDVNDFPELLYKENNRAEINSSNRYIGTLRVKLDSEWESIKLLTSFDIKVPANKKLNPTFLINIDDKTSNKRVFCDIKQLSSLNNDSILYNIYMPMRSEEIINLNNFTNGELELVVYVKNTDTLNISIKNLSVKVYGK